MNTIYRIVWNAATGKWVVASELAKGRKKKARVVGFAVALALGLSFGGNVAMADTAKAGDACTMPSGAEGTVDGSGYCMTGAGGSMGVQSIGTMAAVDDAMVKVNGSAASVATGTNTIAIGSGAQSDSGSGGDGNVAIGSGATIQNTGAGAIAMGRNATIQASGGDSSITGAGSIAIGDGAKVLGNNAIAMGANASAQQTNAIAIGAGASATGANSVAVGNSAKASANNSVALGSGVSATRDNTVAVGSRQVVNVSAGTQANDAVNVSQLTSVVTALGGGASINGTTGAVTGPTYSVGGTTVNNVGDAITNLDGRATDNTTNISNLSSQIADGTIGLVQQDPASKNITVAAGTGGNNVDFTGTDGARTLSGVANGELSDTSTQAVNGSQLNATNVQVTQNTTDISTLNTSVTNLDGRVTTNETNITNLQSQIGAGTVGLVQQDASGNVTVAATKGGNVVNVSGTDGARKITGVANATLSDTSSEAVNGSQLNDTNNQVAQNTTNISTLNTSVTNLDGRVTTNETNITNLQSQIGDGTIGLVQQDAATKNITVAAAKGGAVVDVTGTDGARKVTGVADGTLSATSTDAVTGKQLNAINQQVTQNTTNISTLNTSVTNLDGRVTTNETNVTQLKSQVEDGTTGLVQQDAATGNITVGAHATGGNVSVAGTNGARVVSGVANGTDDDSAVTIAQLKAVGLVDADGNSVAALTYDDATKATARLGGTAGTVIDNLAAGRIASGSMQAVNGGQVYDLQQNFQGQVDSLNGQVGRLSDRVSVVEQGVGKPGPGNGGGYTPAPGTGENSLAVGEGANASGSNSAAVGNGAVASGDNSSAIGNGAVASGSSGTAIGAGAAATGDNSVALGAGSVADRANSVSVGSAGSERQITNVAAGTAPTDAVNVQQLNDARDWAQSYTDSRANALDRKIDKVSRSASAGTAAAIAVANLPQAYAPGQSAVSAGVGTFNGQTAVAAGMTTISSSGRWVFRGSVVGNNRGDAGAGAGAAMVW
nr:ESPR-type extended signal peptide-containing protein [Dyella sp. ASV24]